jgi:hypothetical protein
MRHETSAGDQTNFIAAVQTNPDQKRSKTPMSPTEIQSLAVALAKALAPLLKQRQENQDVLPDGTQARGVLNGATTFGDADRRLARGGVENPGKRRAMIAKHSPNLFNAIMREPYTG